MINRLWRWFRHGSPAALALWFLLASILWIVVTDTLVQALVGAEGSESVSGWQSAKGLLYVVGTTLILLVLLALRERRASSAEEREIRRFRKMADSGLIGMHLWREDGALLEPNDRYLRTVGLTREEFDRGNANWRDFTAPEFREADERAVEETLKRGECEPFEKEILRKDGTRARVVSWGAKLNGSGFGIALILDISNLDAARRDFQTIFHHATDGILVMGPDNRFIDANPSILAMLGYEKHELIGKTYQHVIAAASAQSADDARKGLDSDPSVHGKISLKRKDGTPVPIEYNATRLPDGRYFSIVRDRTEESRSRADLERVANQLREAQRIGRIGSWESNLLTGELELSDEAFSVFGHEPENFTGLRSWFYNIVHPEDLALVRDIVNSAIEKQAVFELEHRVVLPDGSPRWLLSHARVKRDDSGKPLKLLGVSQVIHERKLGEERLRESEDRYRKIIHYSNDAVILGGAKGEVLFASPAIERITGYSPEDFAKLDQLAMVHEDDRLKVKDIYSRVLSTNGIVFRSVHRFKHKAGHWVWVENTVTSWLEDPAIGAIIGNIHDVTDRMSLQEQLNHASKMDGIGRLAGGVAHDFNNLLTAISGYAQLLDARIGDDSVAASQAERIIDAAGRASDLTRRLLAFSRRQLLQPKIIDLNERVTEMDVLLRHIIGEQVELVIKPAGNLSNVSADPGQIDQVILNLAVNARDAMPKGGRLVIETSNVTLDETYASVHPEVVPGRYVMLCVSDNGVGMDHETKSRAFEPFFTTKEAGQGTGLGLAMVYGIVRQSHGHVWLYSEPGRGTVFKIYLPATDEDADESDSSPVAPPAHGTETILVAEDEDAVRTLVSDVLDMHGYKVLAARNGSEALQLLPGMDVKLLLTDVVMPGMSGKELADTVCEQCPDVKVIYMSGYTDDAIVQDGNILQGVEFMQKPFSPSALLKRIREVLDNGGEG